MSGDLSPVVIEIEQHVSSEGWDQPARLFALVRTAELAAAEPELAAQLGLADDAYSLTPVEQEEFPTDDLEAALAQIGWPPEVAGVALAIERVVLPPQAEADLPDSGDVAAAAAAHPAAHDVRLVVAVDRDGGRSCAIRVRGHDEPGDVAVGADLAPALADALAATLAD
ncbi:MAG: hypothetical protein EPO13_10580 [Actinomycetota bacterium]|nr:MAG: hypothetical protein EPO13_10580 [Actinomycetota bacterium]